MIVFGIMFLFFCYRKSCREPTDTNRLDSLDEELLDVIYINDKSDANASVYPDSVCTENINKNNKAWHKAAFQNALSEEHFTSWPIDNQLETLEKISERPSSKIFLGESVLECSPNK